MKIYTRTGDKGETSLIGGARVAKSDLRLHAYGTVDELNSSLGFLIVSVRNLIDDGANSALQEQLRVLQEIQIRLFDLGSQLATTDTALRAQLPNVSPADITKLEMEIDSMDKPLPPLKNFVMPGGCEASARAHLSRTICRRAERWAVEVPEIEPIGVQFLNRLSDYLFVFARSLNAATQTAEVLWQPSSKK